MAFAQNVVKFGVFEPLTGANAAGGAEELDGIRLAQSLYPTVTVGGVTYKIELAIADNKSDKVEAANAGQSLVDRDKVNVVLGSWGSGLSMAAGPIFQAAKVPAIGLSCTNPLVTKDNPYYFRVCFIDPFQGTVMATYANKNLGAKKAIIIREVSNDYSVGLAKFFADAFVKLTGDSKAIVATLILTIMAVFGYEVWIARPDMPQVFAGLLPTTQILHPAQLTMALGIVGATVMPHNLYLHSSIVQSRVFDRQDDEEKARALRFSTIDSNVQLSAAFVVNCLLLVLGAALFYGTQQDLSTFGSLYSALQNPAITGSVASPVLSTLFAVALLASGQNSTITGTLTGQVVMEGFIRLRIPLWMRRMVTRLLAVIPVLVCTMMFGGSEVALDNLLIDTQVFLSIALPVSMVPLVWFTSSKRIMGERFANRRWVSVAGWTATVVLTVLNLQLIVQTVHGLL